MNKIELSDVSFSYSKNTPFEIKALDHVNLGFEEGVMTGLIGHTGSGKSTLVSMLNGLLRPDSGKVLLDGADIWEKPKEIAKVRFRVGVVMQYPEYQLFDETVAKDIGFAPRNLGLSDAEIAERVDFAAHFAGVGKSMLSLSPFDLSGGQKRRVAIAGVMAMKPDVLVLDEPAAGLDPRGRTDILGGICRYAEANHTTVILVSHSMEDMAYYCSRVAVMDSGKVHANGSVSEIFADPAGLSSIGLDVPEATRIADRLMAAGIPLDGDLSTVESTARAIADAYFAKSGGVKR